MKTAITLLLFFSLLLGTNLHAQLSKAPPFPGPTHPRAIPDYGTNTITFSWSDNSRNEAGFQVYRSEDGGPWANIAITLPNVTSYVDAAVNMTSEYRYKVRAANGFGTSSFTPAKRQSTRRRARRRRRAATRAARRVLRPPSTHRPSTHQLSTRRRLVRRRPRPSASSWASRRSSRPR